MSQPASPEAPKSSQYLPMQPPLAHAHQSPPQQKCQQNQSNSGICGEEHDLHQIMHRLHAGRFSLASPKGAAKGALRAIPAHACGMH
jgi:hypothetical protein